MGKYKKRGRVLGDGCLHLQAAAAALDCRSCLRELRAGLPWDSQSGGDGCKNSTDLLSAV